MTASFLQRLLLPLTGALLVAGIAAAAVHDDDGDSGTAAERGGPRPGGTDTSAANPIPPAPSTRLPAPAEPAAPGPGAVPEQGTRASSAGPAAGGTTSAGESGLGASGNGEMASGGTPLADTGPPPLALPGVLLLALAGLGRSLVRAAGRRAV